MTRLTLLLLSFLLVSAPATAQTPDAGRVGPLIESTSITGIALNRLSPGLRHDIDALGGTALDEDVLRRLAERIQEEHPEVVAAGRQLPLPDGRVRVVFLVARIEDDKHLTSNINARYPVTHVEIDGVDESRFSQTLRDDVHALVGLPLDADELDRLAERMRAELPDYDVGHTVSRGDEPGRVKLVFRIRQSESSRWVHFRPSPSPSKLVYHQQQGWSGAMHLAVQGERNLFSVGLVRGNNDDLVEEYTGYSFGIQNRHAGSKRLGLSLDLSRYTQKWNALTLEELNRRPDIPGVYRRRVTIQPTVTFALTRTLSVTGGMIATELTPLAETAAAGPVAGLQSSRVNAGIAEVGFDRTWGQRSSVSQRTEASYRLQAGTAALQSDLIYRRHIGEIRYRARRKSNSLMAELRVGRITGEAPLFARFSLGDTSTLRGWNKYDIAPAGASRMVYQSVEYRFKNLGWFLDTGTLWVQGEDARVRVATGLGVYAEHVTLTLGMPLNGPRLKGVFMAGIRF
ncbi:MAG: BamA/TamA family outer membrane protein [Vicinamibacterales bacterium]